MVAKVLEFGPFQFDPVRLELRRRGIRVRLSISRLRLLLLFLARPGELITREEVIACLWKDGQNVDVTSGVNTAVKELRAAIDDDSSRPRYIETVVGAGYRFIAKVTESAPAQASPVSSIPGPLRQPPAPMDAVHSEELAVRDRATATAIAAEPQVAADSQAGLQSSRSPSPALPARRWMLAAYAVAATVIVAALTVAAISRQRSSGLEIGSGFHMDRITLSGDVEAEAISPDGNVAAYVRRGAGRSSLWIKQLANGQANQLAALGTGHCPGMDFSPDGKFLYYSLLQPFASSGELYRISILGGESVLLLNDVSGAPVVSPDGRKIAFVRSTMNTHGIDSVVVAGSDGTAPRILASYPAPGIHFNRLTWAAHGELLVFCAGSKLIAQPAGGGNPRTIDTSGITEIYDVWAISAGQELLVVGSGSNSELAQLYLVSLSGGSVRPLMHDLSNYRSARATADGKTLIAIQSQRLTELQTLTPGMQEEARFAAGGSQSEDGFMGLAWTQDEKLVYTSQSDRKEILSLSESNGSNPQQLLAVDLPPTISYPAVSPRGDFLVFSQWSTGDQANIWRLGMKDGRLSRLTDGIQDFPASVTPDGQWVVYGSVLGDKSVLMKVSSNGGPPIQLADYSADNPVISPDGAWIACSHSPQDDPSTLLYLVSIAGGPPARTFALPPTADPFPLVWAPDGKSVAFINHLDGVDNIWQQPIAGGPVLPVTHFDSGRIFSFDWSRNGRLALSHGSEMTNAVLIRTNR